MEGYHDLFAKGIDGHRLASVYGFPFLYFYVVDMQSRAKACGGG